MARRAGAAAARVTTGSIEILCEERTHSQTAQSPDPLSGRGFYAEVLRELEGAGEMGR